MRAFLDRDAAHAATCSSWATFSYSACVSFDFFDFSMRSLFCALPCFLLEGGLCDASTLDNLDVVPPLSLADRLNPRSKRCTAMRFVTAHIACLRCLHCLLSGKCFVSTYRAYLQRLLTNFSRNRDEMNDWSMYFFPTPKVDQRSIKS